MSNSKCAGEAVNRPQRDKEMNVKMNRVTDRRALKGFTLIELLIVIAIIAILAAILFPVFNRVREQSRQTTCLSNMHDIYVGLKLYEQDNHTYPPVLWQFQWVDGNGCHYSYKPLFGPKPIASSCSMTTYFGANLLNSDNTYSCPDNPVRNPQAAPISIIYPQTAAPTLAGQTVLFTQLMQHNANVPVPFYGNNIPPAPVMISPFDSYDIGPELDQNGDPVRVNGGFTFELHYSLDWTGASGPGDAPNQLKYADTAPSNRTVITWCTYHAAVNGSSNTLVLLLDGTSKAVDAKTFSQKGPLNFAQ